MYASRSLFIAVRKPFCNNALSTSFAVEYGYKFVLGNQLVLMFHHRVTATSVMIIIAGASLSKQHTDLSRICHAQVDI